LLPGWRWEFGNRAWPSQRYEAFAHARLRKQYAIGCGLEFPVLLRVVRLLTPVTSKERNEKVT
jgi:hypothetical protein